MTSPPEPATASTQVVVVGAGPVGLLLAGELRRAEVPVIIVERLASAMTESRASQLSTLSAEFLHERGFDPLLDEAAPEPRSHFAGLSFDLSALDSDYAGNWKVPQYRTEAILGQRAQQLGAALRREHELTWIDEHDDQIVCGIESPMGELRLQARYLVGCDGAASTVRRLAGFTSSGTTATKELLRADVTGVRIRDRRFERLERGFAVASTRDGVTRVMVHAFGREVTERVTTPEFPEVARLWEEVTGEDISGGNAIWVDSFDNSLGLVDSYRRGRILLAGDAAHWHMPIGGQALNLGLHDAVNLGWKLAGSVNGWAPPAVLDSYHTERHGVAARVLDYVAAQELLLLGGRDIEPLRALLAELVGLDQVRDHLARVVSGLDDRYGAAGSPLVGRRIASAALRCESGVVTTLSQLAGDELAPVVVRLSGWRDVAGDVATPRGGSRLRSVRVPGEHPFLPGITTILLRPDGYIAWAGDDEAELDLAIEQWFAVART